MHKRHKKATVFIKKNYIKIILASFFLIFLCFSSIFIVSGFIIGNGVKRNCNEANLKYRKDCLQSLIMLLNDEQNPYRQRNYAVWALGQLGDKKALPVLEKYYTGKILLKESLDENLSQYELKKAINLVNGGPNITSYIWRYNIE